MEREEVILKWKVEQNYCRVAFSVKGIIYLLIRKIDVIDMFDFEIIFGFKKEKEHLLLYQNARELWIMLKNKYNFEEVKV